jgi:hypothetical protein
MMMMMIIIITTIITITATETSTLSSNPLQFTKFNNPMTNATEETVLK